MTAGADVLSGGREPGRPRYPLRQRQSLRLLVLAAVAVTAAAIGLAARYHAEAVRLRHRPPAAVRTTPPVLPQLSNTALPLPAGGGITAEVFIAAATRPGADRGQFVLSAVITGARPGTVYDLRGNDCSAVYPLPDYTLATGVTSAAGSATLAGHPWTGALADEYWLALDPSPASRPPGLRGRFAQAAAAAFPAGQAPCAPPP